MYANLKEACENTVRTGDSVIPEKSRAERYDKYFKFFQSLYPLFKSSYGELARL